MIPIKHDPDYPDKIVVVMHQSCVSEDDLDLEKHTISDFCWFTCYYTEMLHSRIELLAHGRGEHGNVNINTDGEDWTFSFGKGYQNKNPGIADDYLYLWIHGIGWEKHLPDEFRVAAPAWADEEAAFAKVEEAV